jgi:hypothetical protein
MQYWAFLLRSGTNIHPAFLGILQVIPICFVTATLQIPLPPASPLIKGTEGDRVGVMICHENCLNWDYT